MATQKKELPETAAQFVRTLEPTHKRRSLLGYRVALRSFHFWLDGHAVSLDTLERRHMSAWLCHLNDLGLAPTSINQRIIFVRLYLRWLYEQGGVTSFPDHLIRVSDMVKEPKHLPRPLSPVADKEIQERLAEAGDIYSLGLLLMRKTGLRNGELRALEQNCVRRDHLGNLFLKVPLGKLNTERLVPIDERTVALIERLKGGDEESACKRFLLETKTGKKTPYIGYVKALAKAGDGLETNGKMGTHRLRHTYATTLLNAGMSLVGIMKLLGHNDHRMTLRYAEITQETVGKEYFQALSRLECRYSELLNTSSDDKRDANPHKMLEDVVHLLAKTVAHDDSTKTVARIITKRIRRIQRDLVKLFPILPTNP